MLTAGTRTLATALLLGAATLSGQALRFSGPMNSQPLALSADEWVLAAANPDNNTVTLFDIRPGFNIPASSVRVGVEPWGVAVSPDGLRVYAANTGSGTVSVIAVDRANYNAVITATINVGTEPYALCLTASGRKLYVANARSNTVSVIDTATNQVIRTIAVGPEPRGIAITNSGGDDAQETVYVTQFLARPVAGKLDGADDAKVGKITVISAGTDAVTGEITLNPLADSGFRAAGDALARIAPPAAPTADDFRFTTGAYPNQLNGIAIKGRFAFVPNTGASPNGPVRFNVNTQSLLNVIDRTAAADAGRTINMHVAVARQTATPRRFITQPWAVAFKRNTDEGYVVSAASDILVKVRIDPATGAPTVLSDPANSGRVLQIATGKNPRGIALNASDTRGYVMNYVSRSVSIVDLAAERVTQTMVSAPPPAPGSPEDAIHIGKELYHSAIGEFDPATPGGPAITGRLSDNAWGSCGSCHPFGLTDNVVWLFAAGPRRTIPQHADFVRGDARSLRALNWSAIFDEQEDFEANIRNVSGGLGLIVQADGVTPDPALGAFAPANGGRRQLKVRGVNAWDAIKAYIVSGIRSPISPVSKSSPDVVAGRRLFTDWKCQNCHGGPLWSNGKVRHTAPPDASLLNAGQLLAELKNVGSFDARVANEVRANAAPPLGAAGFNPPTLLSLFAFPETFFHNGSANTLEDVLANVAHRSAGTGGVDRATNAAERRQVIQFLLSIDAATEPIAPDAPQTLQSLSAASYTPPTAPESIAAGFGAGLATQVTPTTAATLPFALGGTSLSIRDAAGVLRLGQLFFTAPGQINFVVPAGATPGTATIDVATATGATATGSLRIDAVAPGIFSANGDGAGVPAATGIRVTPAGAQVPVAVFQCGATAGSCVPAAIDLGSGDVYLTLYGTGIRRRTALSAVRCTIGGADANVLFAGAQGEYPGLDQVNLQVPASLLGRGTVSLVLTVDGTASNAVTLNVQ